MMGRKALAVVLILVVFGWAFLGIETAAHYGLLAGYDAGPNDLKITTKTVTVNGTKVFVLEWSLRRTPVQLIRKGRDAVFLMYPMHITGPMGGQSFLNDLDENVTLTVGSQRIPLSLLAFYMDYLPVSGYLSFKLVLRSTEYPLPKKATSGRIEIPLVPFNGSRCSEIPIVFAYFHDTGGKKLAPEEVQIRLKLHPGPDYPAFANRSVESILIVNSSELVHRAFWGDRGGWLRVEVFNVTLPCGFPKTS
ncbi:hypothetical protein [Thermococcus sp. MAR1]|uniref:hypothetical protein n=1 Tax=Thermococcus sp. MAR1 TaxID=1638263 RepID=UPI0014394329|nr:hypothetical protein [Thermococcus sp. MAR1]NJE09709.1 hypothetical protein [Thermococcus sp. MAR1]